MSDEPKIVMELREQEKQGLFKTDLRRFLVNLRSQTHSCKGGNE